MTAETLAKIQESQNRHLLVYRRQATKALGNSNRTVSEEILASMVMHLTAHYQSVVEALTDE